MRASQTAAISTIDDTVTSTLLRRTYLYLSLLQTNSYQALLDTVTEYLTDRFTILHGEGKDFTSEDAFRTFAWLNGDCLADLTCLEHMVDAWSDEQEPSEHVNGTAADIILKPFYRLMDQQTLQAVVPFAYDQEDGIINDRMEGQGGERMVETVGTVVLQLVRALPASPTKPSTTIHKDDPIEFQLPTHDHPGFLFHSLYLTTIPSMLDDYSPSILAAVEAFKCRQQQQRQTYFTEQTKEERDYWDQYGDTGEDDDHEEGGGNEDAAGKGEGGGKKDAGEDSEDDYWEAYDDVMDKNAALYSL
ncbi:hypothetical protein HDV00_001590 [Rhizophlyctis rosea]|nr:hypothetical protein HDV00_001590 [Rhizophlyctis rosea]